MSQDNIYRVDWRSDVWLAGTSMLGPNEGWLYITIINLIYSHGGPIPEDAKWLGKVANMHGRSVSAALTRLLSLGKVHREDGGLMANRCRKELENALKRVRNGRENALKRWANDSETQPKSNGLSHDNNALTAQVALPLSNATNTNTNTNTNSTPPKPPSRGARKRNGADPWPQLADLTRQQLAARINHIKGHEHYHERQEIKRRLGYIVPPD